MKYVGCTYDQVPCDGTGSLFKRTDVVRSQKLSKSGYYFLLNIELCYSEPIRQHSPLVVRMTGLFVVIIKVLTAVKNP